MIQQAVHSRFSTDWLVLELYQLLTIFNIYPVDSKRLGNVTLVVWVNLLSVDINRAKCNKLGRALND